MDVVAVVRSDRPLPRPAQLPVHGVLSETLGLAAAERLRLPQLPEGRRASPAFPSLPSSSSRHVPSSPSFFRYVRTMVLIWTLVQRGRCWVCWWTPTVVSTCTSTAWTRAWRRRTFLRPATPSSTSMASVSRSANHQQRTKHASLRKNPRHTNDNLVVIAGYYSNKQCASCGRRQWRDPLSGRHGEGGHG